MTIHSLTYQESLDFLYQFISTQRVPAPTPQTAMQKLARMRRLLDLIDHPEADLCCIIVGGTNGKGSTCAMLEHMLRAAGYRTGLWTSPHLSSYRERIQVNRQLIPREELIAQVGYLQQEILPHFAVASDPYALPTTFELGLAIALRYFHAQMVDYAIIEVGLGGRYDACNVLTPQVSALCAIGYDHMDILGSTLTAIATDKAGIMRQNIPTVTVVQRDEAAVVLDAEAAHVGALLWVATPDALCSGDVRRPYPVSPETRLYGAFQQANARLALGVALLLREEQGCILPDTALATGLQKVQWAGRMEIAAHSPLVVLDGAHNADAAHILLHSLRQAFTFRRLLLVLGVSRGGGGMGVLEVLVPHAAVVVLTHHATHPRAQADLVELSARVFPYLHGILSVRHDVGTAIRYIQAQAHHDDLICITGSLFVVGAAREVLNLVVHDDLG
jgi:dihydrofolate synthase/folylpolyglutamate synthase